MRVERGRVRHWGGRMGMADQARMAWISGPAPRIAIIRFTM
jgi:hypothetical protein